MKLRLCLFCKRGAHESVLDTSSRVTAIHAGQSDSRTFKWLALRSHTVQPPQSRRSVNMAAMWAGPCWCRWKLRSPRTHPMLHAITLTQRPIGAARVGSDVRLYNHHKRVSCTEDTKPHGAGTQRIRRTPRTLKRDCCSEGISRLCHCQHQAKRKNHTEVPFAWAAIIRRRQQNRHGRTCPSLSPVQGPPPT